MSEEDGSNGLGEKRPLVGVHANTAGSPYALSAEDLDDINSVSGSSIGRAGRRGSKSSWDLVC